jgi:hypothetical protein
MSVEAIAVGKLPRARLPTQTTDAHMIEDLSFILFAFVVGVALTAAAAALLVT